jgi:orotidine-5'-phosphate decarboxylase
MAVNAAERIFVAIDRMDPVDAGRDIARVAPGGGGVKLGLEFFVANGPAGIRAARPENVRLFLDLKLHDIPNTVAGAMRGACRAGAQLVTIHAAGGLAMMRAALAAARESAGAAAPRLLAITVLTSLDDADLDAVGQRGPVAEQVRRLADLAQQAGVAGVVCSPHEVATCAGSAEPASSWSRRDPPELGGERRPEARHHACRGDRRRGRSPRHRSADHPGQRSRRGARADRRRDRGGRVTALVKICGLTTPDAVAATASADFAGFNFYRRSPRYVTPDQAAALAAALPPTIPRVAVTVDADDATLAAIVTALRPAFIQLHGAEGRHARRRSARISRVGAIKVIAVAAPADLAAADRFTHSVDWLMFDAKPPARADALPGGKRRVVRLDDAGRPDASRIHGSSRAGWTRATSRARDRRVGRARGRRLVRRRVDARPQGPGEDRRLHRRRAASA